MATENIPQMDKLIKDFGKQFQEEIKRVNKTLEKVGVAIKKYRESEEKSMLHNVTVKREENKVLEKYWLMRAIKDGDMYGYPQQTPKRVIAEKELDHEPTPNEIAQLLYESHADFVSVVQNYRFENELPFC